LKGRRDSIPALEKRDLRRLKKAGKYISKILVRKIT
jgi:hypothetical protein